MNKSGIFPNKLICSMVTGAIRVVFLLFCLACKSQPEDVNPASEVRELDNAFFKSDPFWRGADGAASLVLDESRILWLFSDTFIDVKRSEGAHV